MILVVAARNDQERIGLDGCVLWIADRVDIQMVGRIVDDIFRLDLEIRSPLAERYAAQPFPVHAVNRQDPQLLIGEQVVRIILQYVIIGGEYRLRLKAVTIRDARHSVALLNGIRDDFLSGPLRHIGMQVSLP